jgi:hypothetical protein
VHTSHTSPGCALSANPHAVPNLESPAGPLTALLPGSSAHFAHVAGVRLVSEPACGPKFGSVGVSAGGVALRLECTNRTRRRGAPCQRTRMRSQIGSCRRFRARRCSPARVHKPHTSPGASCQRTRMRSQIRGLVLELARLAKRGHRREQRSWIRPPADQNRGGTATRAYAPLRVRILGRGLRTAGNPHRVNCVELLS